MKIAPHRSHEALERPRHRRDRSRRVKLLGEGGSYVQNVSLASMSLPNINYLLRKLSAKAAKVR